MVTPAESKTREAVVSLGDPGAEARVRALQCLAVAGTLLIIAFWPILVGIYGSWFDENAYMEHGILVVPAAAYMAWDKRATLKGLLPQPSFGGLWTVFVGTLLALLGIATQWFWLSRMAFLVSLLGCLAATYGWRLIRELSYPLATLVLMITPPTFIFERLTLSLQLLASRLGETWLEALGFSVLREGNILEMVSVKLSVVEACSGIRSLLAILFCCVMYNYFFVKGRAMKTLVLVAAVPIAILGNAVRIVATGIASQYRPAWVTGTMHEAFGYVSVVSAAIGVILMHMLMLSIQRTWASSRGRSSHG